MGKRVVFSVAGSGKTTYLVESIDSKRRTLLLTYTHENYRNLKRKVIQRFGCIPENVRIARYYQFLYSFCFRPLYGRELDAKGIYWDEIPPRASRGLPLTNIRHYQTASGRMYHNRIAKFLIQEARQDVVNSRLARYYDSLYIDEVQDFASNDFNFLVSICGSGLDLLFVGDFYQHTYDTSRDGNTRMNLHSDFDRYCDEFRRIGFDLDFDTLRNSYRCPPDTCDFIREQLGIEIYSHNAAGGTVEFVTDPEIVERLFLDDLVVKLFLRDHAKYDCFSNNWARSKGIDAYEDVCVVMYKRAETLRKNGTLGELAPRSRNALYVACSRTHRNLFLVPEDALVGKKQ